LTGVFGSELPKLSPVLKVEVKESLKFEVTLWGKKYRQERKLKTIHSILCEK